MKYQVGNLIDFKEEDPWLEDFQSAINLAKNKSLRFFEEFFGIWDEDGELYAIVHQGEVYSP